MRICFITLSFLLCNILLSCYKTHKYDVTYESQSNRIEEFYKYSEETRDSLIKHYFQIITQNDIAKSSIEQKYICADAYTNIGRIYCLKGLYSNAFQMFSSALRIAEKEQINSLYPILYNNIGLIYCAWLDPNQGIKYFIKGIQSIKDTNEKQYTSLIINLIGAYCQMGDDRNAKAYIDKLKKMEHSDLTVFYYKYYKGFISKIEGKDRTAINHLVAAYEFADSNSMSMLYKAPIFNMLSELYIKSNKDSALYYLHKAIGNNEIPTYIQRESFKKLASFYKSEGMNDSCILYATRYMNLSDSLFNESDINRAKDMQLMYENEKSIEKIAQQSVMIRFQRILLVIGIVIVVVFITMLIILHRQKRKLNQSYQTLFLRSKNLLNIENTYRLKQAELENKIKEIENSGNKTDVTDTEENHSIDEKNKIHSVDKLTEEQKNNILAAFEDIMANTDVICNCNFSLEQLADMTGYNSRYVSQVINDTYKQNFRTILNNYRIKEAEKRLLDIPHFGHYTINAIANSVGYKSHSNFILLFKKQVGITPSLYQKMAREKYNK